MRTQACNVFHNLTFVHRHVYNDLEGGHKGLKSAIWHMHQGMCCGCCRATAGGGATLIVRCTFAWTSDMCQAYLIVWHSQCLIRTSRQNSCKTLAQFCCTLLLHRRPTWLVAGPLGRLHHTWREGSCTLWAHPCTLSPCLAASAPHACKESLAYILINTILVCMSILHCLLRPLELRSNKDMYGATFQLRATQHRASEIIFMQIMQC